METQNVTLSISKEVLLKAKLMAVKQQTSLSSLLTGYVEAMVLDDDEYEQAKQRHLVLLNAGMDLGTNGKITWTREELHER